MDGDFICWFGGSDSTAVPGIVMDALFSLQTERLKHIELLLGVHSI